MKKLSISIAHLSGWVFCFIVGGIIVGNYVGARFIAPSVCVALLFAAIVLLCLRKSLTFDVSILLFFFFIGLFLFQPYRPYIQHKPTKTSNVISKVFHQDFSEYTAKFLDSLILGRRGIDRQTKRIFRDAGTSHVIVISGMHVGIIAFVILLILKSLNIPFKIRYALAALLIVLYSILCFNKPPVLRAAIMFSMFCGFKLLQQPFLKFHVLFMSGIISLLIAPQQLFSISFQLSFTAVLFIMLGFGYVYPLIKAPTKLKPALDMFCVSIFAYIGLLPLISYYFGRIYLLSWFSGTIVVPFLALIIYGVFVWFLFCKLFLGSLAVFALETLIGLFVRLNHFFAQVPAMFVEFRMSMMQVCLYYLLIIVLFIFLKKFVILKRLDNRR